MRNYTIPQDQVQRFNGTIVQFDGMPVYVNVSGSKWTLYKPSMVHEFPNSPILKGVDPYDARVDVSSLTMGYVNIAKYKTVRYLVRLPVKKYQQGITADVVSALKIPNTSPSIALYAQDILFTQDFEDCVTGKYPSLSEGLEYLNREESLEKSREIAIDRSIALAIDPLGIIRVYFRNDLVGWMAPGKKTLNIPSSKMSWVVSHYLQGLDWEIN